MCRVSPSRSGCSGVTPCVPTLSAPATDRFPGMPRKAGSGRQLLGPFVFPLFLFFFLEQKKRVGTPPSREPRTGNRQTESALSLDCSPAQTALCAFNTFESDMWPAAVRFFFFPFAFRPSPISSWPSAERHFHLGNWAGAGARQADGGHGRGYDAPSPLEGADGSEGRANGSGGRASSCEPSPRDPNMVSCSFQWSFSPSASAEKGFWVLCCFHIMRPHRACAVVSHPIVPL